MSKPFDSAADALPEGRIHDDDGVAVKNPAGSRHSSLHPGVFSLRRARYIKEARLDRTGHGVRRSDIAEAAIDEVSGEFQQGDIARERRNHNPRR